MLGSFSLLSSLSLNSTLSDIYNKNIGAKE